MRTLDPETPQTMIASATEQGAASRVSDLRAGGLGSRDDLVTWLRLYRADEEALDALPEADRERVYDAAWAAYTAGETAEA